MSLYHREGIRVRSITLGDKVHIWGVTINDTILYITSTASIWKVSSQGNVLKKVAGEKFGKLCGIAVSMTKEEIFVCDQSKHCIHILDTEFNHLRCLGSHGYEIGQFVSPQGVAVGEDGQLYVADFASHRVQVFSDSGTVLRVLGSYGKGQGELKQPSDVCAGGNGLVYVADTANNRVSVFQSSGEFVACIEAGNVWGIAVDDSGYMYVSVSNRIDVY